jgi:hypothetical protein
MTRAPLTSLPALFAGMVAALMVFVLISGPVTAAPLAPASTPVGEWSYGVVKTYSVGPLRAVDGWVYEGNATLGYTVTAYENNTSSSTFELTLHRTMGVAFSVEFCLPSCSAPVNWVELAYRAWETTTAFANFTTQGTVAENGTSVPAIALDNSSVWVHANVTESAVEHLPRLGWTVNQVAYLSADVQGHATVDFAPPLGLFPLNLVPGSSWSSTSAFQSFGFANYSYYYAASGPFHNATTGPVSGPITVATQGNVTVEGSYEVGSTVDLGGVIYPAISLTVIGPFSVREGVIFLPSGADVFGGSSPPWSDNQNGASAVSQSNLDVKPFEAGHFGLGASSWRYSSDSTNPADSTGIGAAVGGLTPSVLSSNPVSSTTVQGEPESTAQATSADQCLTGGGGCPLIPSNVSLARSLFSVLVLSGAVAIIGALIALAVVSSRRRLPPPAYPNATLYPPGVAIGPATARPPSAPGAPPPPEDDPLDHLW